MTKAAHTHPLNSETSTRGGGRHHAAVELSLAVSLVAVVVPRRWRRCCLDSCI